ncbi:MAG TPA: hypothetical protein VHY08_20795 [Bacillota bacterium]|nr:hypothetical protein [Bacillota bacterium]
MNQPYKFDLQYFAESETEPAKNNVAPDGKNGEGEDEAITFKTQAAFNARMQREAKKLFETQIKELGFESAEQMKNLLQTAKEQEEAKKTELQKEKERADKAETEKIKTIETANQILKEAAIQIQAASLQVKPQRIKTLLKLIDLSEIKIEKGIVDDRSVKDAVNAILTEMPELIDKASPNKAGESFNEGSDGQRLTLEMIARMSPSEINKSWDKVQATLKKHK